MKTARCGKLTLKPLTGFWYRALRVKYWDTRLSTLQSVTSTSRFSAASPTNSLYRLLYLGENHQIVLYEVGALLGMPTSPASNPGSWVIMSLDVCLHFVVNLCDPLQQKILATNDRELTGIWPNASLATPTQKLGAALYAVPQLEAVVVPSSKPSGGRNLIVFPDKLDPRSSILFHNELDQKSEKLR
jgi:hypothetical protein